MRHHRTGRRFNRSSSHRIAMLRNMAVSLFKHERIKTTDEKCKELRRFAEKLITRAKKGDVQSRQIVAREIHDPRVVKKLFTTLAERYSDRPGGYTRIVKIGRRSGDAAAVSFIELVDNELEFE